MQQNWDFKQKIYKELFGRSWKHEEKKIMFGKYTDSPVTYITAHNLKKRDGLEYKYLNGWGQ